MLFGQKNRKGTSPERDQDRLAYTLQDVPSQVSSNLKENEKNIMRVFDQCSDLILRSFRINGEIQALLICIDGLINHQIVDEIVLKPPMYDTAPKGEGGADELKQESVPAVQAKITGEFKKVTEAVLYGEVAIFIEGQTDVFLVDAKGWTMRAIEEPETQTVIRGPREGFNENIRTGTAMLRKRLRTPRLKMESFNIGDVSHTSVVLTYIDGIVHDSLVQEVRDRLKRIVIDGVMDSGYIEEMIEDAPYSPFPTVYNTERPDIVAANLLEGRVAVLVDNTPFALVMPTTFWNSVSVNEDYYERFWVATVVRWIRYLGVAVTMFLPGLYVSIVTFHQEMLPTSLLLSIASAREGVPFPVIIEVLLMEITFEGLREAGLRLPRQVGQAVSIVGALVIGQAAVQAGIVSAPLVIVVSITGIASFTIPGYSAGLAVRLLRFPLIFAAGIAGLYGLTLSVLFILLHVCGLRSFGVPYFSPVAPLTVSNLKDIWIRAPWWSMRRRPLQPGSSNQVRIPAGQMPKPPKKTGDRS
ncbi:spore germination protein [Paenibacillus typhae]|nr:spore germination protein [Paenibacillus typhae]